MPFQRFTLEGEYLLLDDSPRSGLVIIEPNQQLTDEEDDQITAGRVLRKLDTDGKFSISLPTLLPADSSLFYHLTVRFYDGGKEDDFWFQAPAPSTTLETADITPEQNAPLPAQDAASIKAELVDYINNYLAGLTGTLVVQDENSNVATGVNKLDFQGAGVTATAGTGEVVVTIPGTSGSALTVKDEGVTKDTAVTQIDFVGGGVTATNSGHNVTVTVPAPPSPGISAVDIKDEGTTVSSTAAIDFVGAGVTATNGTGKAIVTIPGFAGVAVQDEGSSVSTAIGTLNFTGAGVTATLGSGKVNIDIPASSVDTSAYMQKSQNLMDVADPEAAATWLFDQLPES